MVLGGQAKRCTVRHGEAGGRWQEGMAETKLRYLDSRLKVQKTHESFQTRELTWLDTHFNKNL